MRKYREFTVTDEGGLQYIFKHFPDELPKSDGLIAVEKDEIPSSLDARAALIALIRKVTVYMSDNTINKIEIEEKEEV